MDIWAPRFLRTNACLSVSRIFFIVLCYVPMKTNKSYRSLLSVFFFNYPDTTWHRQDPTIVWYALTHAPLESVCRKFGIALCLLLYVFAVQFLGDAWRRLAMPATLPNIEDRQTNAHPRSTTHTHTHTGCRCTHTSTQHTPTHRHTHTQITPTHRHTHTQIHSHTRTLTLSKTSQVLSFAFICLFVHLLFGMQLQQTMSSLCICARKIFIYVSADNREMFQLRCHDYFCCQLETCDHLQNDFLRVGGPCKPSAAHSGGCFVELRLLLSISRLLIGCLVWVHEKGYCSIFVVPPFVDQFMFTADVMITVLHRICEPIRVDRSTYSG